ncbi:MAG: gephyrin-like molybdotransferase Glp [Acidimicrobiales bacterium]
MISLAEAQQLVRQWLSPLPPVELPLGELLGRVVAEDLVAREAVPGFLNSAMDGYAVRSIDTAAGSAHLAVIDSVLAGDGGSRPLGTGEAVRIMTGAPVPDGADCVVMIEEVTVDPDGQTVHVQRVMEPGEHVRRPGDDVAVGQLLAAKGTTLGPAHLGVLASQGIARAWAHPRPRVGVLSTGHELGPASGPLEPGQIRDSNRPMLLALLRASGFTPIDLGTAEDQPNAIADSFRRGLEVCDAVVSTGGVSVGDADYVKVVVGDLCGERHRSMRVAIRPGKPFAFGVAGERRTPLFGLAGNPVSTYVGFEMLVRPALRLLAGQAVLERLTVDMVLDTPLRRRPDGRLHMVFVVARVLEDGRWHAQHSARQGSHLLSAVAGSNAIAMVPDGDGFEVGGIARAMIIDADPAPPDGARTRPGLGA